MKPNVLLMIADDATYTDLALYGGENVATPHIDALGQQGLVFNRAYLPMSMCNPCRTALYTGLHPVRNGSCWNHSAARPGTKSIVHYLRPLGYRVTQTGKTHINPREVFPFENFGAGKNPDMNYIDRLFAETAKGGKPFCLFACSNEPHSPWNKGDASAYPPKEVKLPPYIVDTPRVRSDFSKYLAEITYFDSQVGEILALLDKHKLVDNTLVMVVSEQGNAFPFAKWTCYDHGLQSAMVVRWPGRVKPGAVSDAMVEYVDVAPTFIDTAGGKPVAALDGKSFLPVLVGEAKRHKEHVFGIMTTRGINNGTDAFAIRSVRGERYKLILNLNHESQFTNACTKMPLFQSMIAKANGGDRLAKRLVYAYQHRPAVELFDLKADPLEMNNIASQAGSELHIKRLRGKLEAWMEAQGDEGVATEMKAIERQRRGRFPK